MVVRVKLEMSAVGKDLDFHLLVEYVHSALSPKFGVLEFGEERTGIEHPLSLEQKMVALLGPVTHNVGGVAVIVHEKFREELRRE